MIPIKKILYESDGKFYDASQALIKGLTENARLFLEYQSGFKAYLNFSEKSWYFNEEGRGITLPKWGFYASTSGNTIWGLAGFMNNISASKNSVDLMHSPDLYYLDSNGAWFNSDDLSGKGKIALKKETFGWEIIPARKFEEFGFSPKLLGLKDVNLSVESLQENGLSAKAVETRWSRGKLFVIGEADGAFKYRIVPHTGSVPVQIICKDYAIKSGQDLDIVLPFGFMDTIISLEWFVGNQQKKAGYKLNGDLFIVTVPKLADDAERVWLKLKNSTGMVYWLDFIQRNR